ncbi:MAG: hypothetical protein [Podoviridae sp. ctviO18]|nr:MAG: hypothetical protein [Podoviridae sp. ctviO18]
MIKLLKWLNKILGGCQCPEECHELGYNSCSFCLDNHKK